MRRANEEALLAFSADEPAVASAHHRLSVLHVAEARRILAEDALSAFPQLIQEADIIEPKMLLARLRLRLG